MSINIGAEMLKHAAHWLAEQGLPQLKSYLANRTKQPAVADPAAAFNERAREVLTAMAKERAAHQGKGDTKS